MEKSTGDEGAGTSIGEAGDQAAAADVAALRAEIDALRVARARRDQRVYELLIRLSHELRSPLGAILMWTHVLRTGREADRAAALDAIDLSARAESRIIAELSDAARALIGKLRIVSAPVAIDPIVRAAVDGLEGSAAKGAVALVVTSGDVAAAPKVMADAGRVEQMIAHLVSNAIKFTPAGGRVEVSRGVDGDEVWISVSDTGAGLSAGVLADLFNPLSMDDAAVVERVTGPGLGLGLAFVHAIATAHGGSIRAESAGLGRGATFTLRLPRAA